LSIYYILGNVPQHFIQIISVKTARRMISARWWNKNFQALLPHRNTQFNNDIWTKILL